MADHAALSPSTRHRWQLCPGSVREARKYSDANASDVANDGTHTHTLLEKALSTFTAPVQFVGQTLTDHVGTFVVDEARAARAAVAYDYVMSRTANNSSVILTEKRVDPQGYTGRSDQSGTVDVQIHLPHEIELIDYKDGYAPVEANCPQLRQYGVGLLAEQLPGRFKVIRLTVVQPKLKDRGMEPVRTWVESVEDFLRTEIPALIAEGAATDKEDAPLVPGEVQCKYCPARGSCSARAQAGIDAMGMMFQASPLSLPIPVVTNGATPMNEIQLATQAANKDPATMDGAMLRQLIDAAPVVRQLLDDAEKEALRRLESGVQIEGLKLVNGRGSREWAFPEDQMLEKLKSMGVPKDHCYKQTFVSVAQAEKLVWEKKDGTKVQLSPRQLQRMEAEFVVKMAGKIKVAPASDPRPSAVIDAAPLFGAVVDVLHNPLPAFLATGSSTPVEDVPDWMKS